MHLSFLFLFAVHAATLHAFPNVWASESNAPSTSNAPDSGTTFLIVHPLDPNDTETIEKTVPNLERICGSEHLETLRSVDGNVSWKVTLSDRKTLRYLAEHPWLKPDKSIGKTLEEFSRRHEKRSELIPRDDEYYNIVAKDYNNDEETKATREFLNTKVTDPSKKFKEFSLPGTSHIIGWGNVQLSEAAKQEVEAYQGVKGLGVDGLVEEDRGEPGWI
jgi:hypothetical protein